MKQRKILKPEVEITVLHPYITAASRVEKYVAMKKAGGKYLEAICRKKQRQNNLDQGSLNKETSTAMVKVEYDPNVDAMHIDAMHIWLRKAKYNISKELAENVA